MGIAIIGALGVTDFRAVAGEREEANEAGPPFTRTSR
jgi:hypothetical protein